MGVTLPVVVEVARPDGSSELVRIGTARRDGAYFVLDLKALRISTIETEQPAPGGTVDELEYIAARARKTLSDASKSRWHEQERALLEKVEHELERRKSPAG